MSRSISNIEIMRKLRDFLQENPDQRFHQALLNLDILRRVQINLGGQNYDHVYVDEAHTESDVTLKRVENRLKYIKGENGKTS